MNPAGDYTLSASPTRLSVARSAKGTSTITVNPLNGFNAGVSLSASGLPSGVTAAFNPSSTTTTSTLTLTASGPATLGAFTVTITGKSGASSHSTTLSLAVTPLPNFVLSASPNSLSLARRGQIQSIITVTPQNAFAASVNLSASGLPRGVTASFHPSATTATSTLTLSGTNKASIGTFSIVIPGASGSLTHTTTISLTVHR